MVILILGSPGEGFAALPILKVAQQSGLHLGNDVLQDLPPENCDRDEPSVQRMAPNIQRKKIRKNRQNNMRGLK
jgi:hypothetical protein